jgi:Radical SAM superfamily/Iron-sulfur cluster-binding domain
MIPDWNNIILFLNRTCPVGCRSCNVAADMKRSEMLDPDWIQAFFRRTDSIPASPYTIWTGGEPFLSFESLCTGIKECRRIGFQAEVLTSGIWYSEHPDKLDELLDAGPFNLRISLDAEHQEKVDLITIELMIRHALNRSISVNFTLRDIPGNPGPAPEYYMEFLSDHFPDWSRRMQSDSRWIHRIPTIPIPPKTESPPKSCPDNNTACKNIPCRLGFKDLVIGPDGQAYPCCGLFAIPGHGIFSMGNPLTDPWESIVRKAETSPLLSTLRNRGPAVILTEIDHRNPPLLMESCAACQILFRSSGTNPPTSLTVILPCAGSGSRLGLQSPKELHEIAPSYPLIRYSLEHIQTYLKSLTNPDISIRIAVVIRRGKEAVYEYVKSFLPESNVSKAYFNDNFREWPGSVMSAHRCFSDVNLVLLPDSLLSLSDDSPFYNADGMTLCRIMMEHLTIRPVAFGWVPCRNPDVLSGLGAVHCDETDCISRFEDKPKEHTDRYNGFWGCYGFRREAGKSLYEFLIQTVEQTTVPIIDQSFHPVTGFPLFSYRDLGSWPSIESFRTSPSFKSIHP